MNSVLTNYFWIGSNETQIKRQKNVSPNLKFTPSSMNVRIFAMRLQSERSGGRKLFLHDYKLEGPLKRDYFTP